MGPQQQVLDFLDTRPEILNWFSILPNSIFIVSDKTTIELTKIIHDRYPNAMFAISPIDPSQTGGWLTQLAWDFINNPKSSGRWR
jgi:hypothetical protein